VRDSIIKRRIKRKLYRKNLHFTVVFNVSKELPCMLIHMLLRSDAFCI